MGRKKTHKKEELLAQAMEVFREHGFAGTSADMLVERIGVSRYSLYSDFGSLRGLFEAALELYNDQIIDQRFGPLEEAGAGLTEIRNILDYYGAASTGPAAGKGCLLCNTAVEFGAGDPTGTNAVQRYFKRLSGAFRNALANAVGQGQLRADVDVDVEADHFTSVVLGLFVLIRAEAPPAVVSNAAATAKARIEVLALAGETVET